MVKLQKTKRGTFIISVPKAYVSHFSWDENTQLNICVTENGLKLVPLRGAIS
jgi:hypothetical protein